jgi:hypothetical protein
MGSSKARKLAPNEAIDRPPLGVAAENSVADNGPDTEANCEVVQRRYRKRGAASYSRTLRPSIDQPTPYQIHSRRTRTILLPQLSNAWPPIARVDRVVTPLFRYDLECAVIIVNSRQPARLNGEIHASLSVLALLSGYHIAVSDRWMGSASFKWAAI